MRSFNEYYLKFLGVGEGVINKKAVATKCEYRDKPLNEKYFYPLIISEYDGRRICSISPKYYDVCRDIYDGTEESIERILKCLNKENNYRLRRMRRYTLDGIENKLWTSAVPLTEEVINFLDFSKPFNKERFIQRKKQVIKDGRQFIKEHEKNVGAMALVSDIYEGGGNIAVFTNDEYRKLGFGKEVVKGCINWCIDEGVLPIYLVEENNIPSIKLAESLGFKLKSEEWIISE